MSLIRLFVFSPPTSNTPEDVAPGGGRGGVGGGAAAPKRYQYTTRSLFAFSPLNHVNYLYSICMISTGYNPLSKIEVVSALNTLNLSTNSLHYNHANCTSRFYPKVYLGTNQTISTSWLYNNDKYWDNSSKIGWPQSYQSNTQKGEANESVL